MNRPHILVNVAMTADGKIDTATRKGAAISSAADKARVDRLRAKVDAILVGGRTLIAEDPKLTIKSEELRLMRKARNLGENPAKVGIVSVADLKPEGDFMTAGPARRLIFTTKLTPPETIARLEKAQAQIFVAGEEYVDIIAMLEALSDQGICTMMVEGGGTLIAELFRLDVVDEVFIYVAPRIFGGASAPTLADGPGFLAEQAPRLKLESVEKFDEDGGILVHYTLPHST